MRFNRDASKHVQKVIFSCALQMISHPSIYFNNNPAKQVPFRKHPENDFRQ